MDSPLSLGRRGVNHSSYTVEVYNENKSTRKINMRARNLKPGFFKNDSLAECDPLARILFQGLWCLADREGRLELRPKRIKAEILPYDNADIFKLLDQLVTKGFIVAYKYDTDFFLSIPTFTEHQNPHIKEAESTIPAPFESDTCTILARLNPESLLLNPESLLLNPVHGLHRKKKDSDLKTEDIPFSDIVSHLNTRTKKAYRDTGAKIRSLITARWNEGFRVPDFERVIDNQVIKWEHDPKMREFLRPETIFGTKFESYLNAVPNMAQAGLISAGTQSLLSWAERKMKEAEDANGRQP
jgi:uncharacterized phage protein (TIGR02220 family)